MKKLLALVLLSTAVVAFGRVDITVGRNRSDVRRSGTGDVRTEAQKKRARDRNNPNQALEIDDRVNQGINAGVSQGISQGSTNVGSNDDNSGSDSTQPVKQRKLSLAEKSVRAYDKRMIYAQLKKEAEEAAAAEKKKKAEKVKSSDLRYKRSARQTKSVAGDKQEKQENSGKKVAKKVNLGS